MRSQTIIDGVYPGGSSMKVFGFIGAGSGVGNDVQPFDGVTVHLGRIIDY